MEDWVERMKDCDGTGFLCERKEGKMICEITKCKTKEYTFWLVDYFEEEYAVQLGYSNAFEFLDWDIFDMRNKGGVRTRTFKTKKQATDFVKIL